MKKQIQVNRFPDLITEIKNTQIFDCPLTPEISKKYAVDDKNQLAIWNYHNGTCEYLKVVGGSIGMSSSNKYRVCIMTKDDNNPHFYTAHIYNSNPEYFICMSPHWEKNWKKAKFGDEFTWNNARQRKTTVDEVCSYYQNKVFLSFIYGFNSDIERYFQQFKHNH